MASPESLNVTKSAALFPITGENRSFVPYSAVESETKSRNSYAALKESAIFRPTYRGLSAYLRRGFSPNLADFGGRRRILVILTNPTERARPTQAPQRERIQQERPRAVFDAGDSLGIHY